MMDLGRYISAKTSVAIIDDHEVVLEGFKNYIINSGITHVETFNKAQPLLDRIHSHPFDVYIVDVELPGIDDSELVESIRDQHPDAKIIVNTMHKEVWLAWKMEEMKVDGVMYKSGSRQQLLKALYTVIKGHKFYCKKSSNNIQYEIPSHREFEILTCIAKGYSTKEIASCLFISENTVENHRKSLFRKLQVHNVAGLIVKSIAAGLIDLEEISKDL